MNVLKQSDIANYSKNELKELAFQMSEQLCVADNNIKALERQLEYLFEALGSEHQAVLFAAEKLAKLQNMHFGRSSERRHNDDSPLFGDSGVIDLDDLGDDESESTEGDKPKPKSKPKRSAGEKVSPNVPREEVVHNFSDEFVRAHDLVEWEGQFETSELITVVPSKVIVNVHKRQKYFQIDKETCEKEIFTAPGPLKLRAGSQYSIEFTNQVVVNKYQNHLPIERQVSMFSSDGLEVTSQTLFNQIGFLASLLEKHLIKRFAHAIEASTVNEADATTWNNLENLDTRTRDKYYLWAVKNDHAVVFNVYNNQSHKVAKSFLGNLRGFLISDCHNTFNILEGPDLVLAADWCHARRRFFDAEKNFPEEAKAFLDLIGGLFKVEKKIKGKSEDEILAARRNYSKPITEAIFQNLNTCPHLPSSSLGKAIEYTYKYWERLTVFLEHPEVHIHTNNVERAIRGPAVGRKNHFGSKNLKTARNAAVFYSVVETCKIHNKPTFKYLNYAVKAIRSNLPFKMPWEWNTE